MITDHARHLIEDVVLTSPVARSLVLALEAVDVDAVALSMPMSDEITTVPGVIHGGVVASLIDTAAAAASASGVSASGVGGDEVVGGATSHLQVACLRPATTGLTAVASVRHRTRTTTYTDVVVSGADGREIARGQVTSRIFHS